MPFPIGTIVSYPGKISATHNCEAQGWYLCDGRVLPTADHPLLSRVLPPSGDGSGITLPDYKGMFLRGVDHGAGNDPNASERYRPEHPEHVVGDVVGSWQDWALGTHSHNLSGCWGVRSGSGGVGVKTGGYRRGGRRTDSAGDTSESRPKNVYVNYLMLGDVR